MKTRREPAPALVIDVGPTEYRVHTDPATFQREQEDMGLRVVGLCDNRKGLIALHPDRPLSHQRTDLAHEVMHACIHQVGGFRFPARATEDDIEEVAVNVMSTVFLDALRRNPALAAFLLGDEPLGAAREPHGDHGRADDNA